MQTDDKKMNLLLISDGSERAAMLRQMMEQQGLNGEIRRMDQGRSAVAFARHSGPYKDADTPDLVLLDMSDPDQRCLNVLKQIALSSARPAAPVVLLISTESEHLLGSGSLNIDTSRVFAPTSLLCFVRKMRQHSRRRFLRALAVMSEIGPILVRLPASFVPQKHDDAALTA